MKNLTFLMALAALLTLGGLACQKADQGPELVSLEISPADIALPAGRSTLVQAQGTYSDGSTASVEVEWTSQDAAVASALASEETGQGIVQAFGTGETTLTASARENGAVSASLTVTVTDAVMETLSVSPATATVPVGLTQEFTVTATFSDGTSGPVAVTWTVSNGAGAAVDAAGTAEGLADGSVTVSAEASDSALQADASLTVTSAVPTALVVSPDPAETPLGLDVVFTARMDYSDGTSGPANVSWSSSNTNVATIDSAGTAGSEAVGTTTITATDLDGSGFSDDVVLTVGQPVLASLSVTPAQASLYMGGTVTLSADGTYTDGTVQVEPVSWSTSDASLATVDSSGAVTAVSAGNVTVTAVADADATISDTAAITVLTAFHTMYINCSSTSSSTVESIPYNGGSGSTFLSSQFNVTSIHIDSTGQNLYIQSRYGHIDSVDLSSQTQSQVYKEYSYSGMPFQGLSMDANGDLFRVMHNQSPRIEKVDTSQWKVTTFCQPGGCANLFDTTAAGSDVYVAYWGGIAKGSSGGTLAPILSAMSGSKLMTTVDRSAGGALYAIDNWPVFQNGNMLYNVWKLKDTNSDGDFIDLGETTLYAVFTNNNVCELKIDGQNDLYVAELDGGTSDTPDGIWKLSDNNGDGDARDAGEATLWSSEPFLSANGGGGITWK